MLIPDNIHPEQTIYFNGAIVLKTIKQNPAVDIIDLYLEASTEREMSMSVFALCLDWLYLLNIITINNSGKVELCS